MEVLVAAMESVKAAGKNVADNLIAIKKPALAGFLIVIWLAITSIVAQII